VKARQELIQACRTDWKLEAKLAVLHTLLVPTSATSGGASPLRASDLLAHTADDNVHDAAMTFWKSELQILNPSLRSLSSEYDDYVAKEVSEVAREILDCQDAGQRLIALRALRDALLGSDGV
jgi:hypothetical protein